VSDGGVELGGRLAGKLLRPSMTTARKSVRPGGRVPGGREDGDERVEIGDGLRVEPGSDVDLG
jgi:hypothetical protein